MLGKLQFELQKLVDKYVRFLGFSFTFFDIFFNFDFLCLTTKTSVKYLYCWFSGLIYSKQSQSPQSHFLMNSAYLRFVHLESSLFYFRHWSEIRTAHSCCVYMNFHVEYRARFRVLFNMLSDSALLSDDGNVFYWWCRKWCGFVMRKGCFCLAVFFVSKLLLPWVVQKKKIHLYHD